MAYPALENLIYPAVGGVAADLIVLENGQVLDPACQAPHIASHIRDVGSLALTPQEILHLGLVAQGLTAPEVAVEGHWVEQTVKFHRGNIMRKFGAYSIKGVIRPALALGLLSLDSDMDVVFTPRETDIIRCASFDMGEAETAKTLRISERTISTHKQNAFSKIPRRNTMYAILCGFQSGSLSLEDTFPGS